ncbi:aspartyl protease family protein [Pseudocolwellia sp. AS88]|uniref:aspartyl protease family protein n=1 Tax=Pseudocolwellia sp. AS88 TaxID=3063958 RepID=UPI0026ED2475|nr:aspartyl protease family protein [Pseudocolwellia sp. AS88]MDO7084406.1 aspartyl protease family protein [Pseudocolwellia sp. AS88]
MDLVVKKTLLEFEISETGHQFVEAKINGKLLRFILDTAAGASVLDRACLSELGIEEKTNKENAGGLGTSDHEMGDIEVPAIELGGTLYENPSFISLNLEHVQVAGGEKGVHGLLGSPFLSKYKAVIDFGVNKIVLTST